MPFWYWWALTFVGTWWVLMGLSMYARIRAMASPSHRLTPARDDAWVTYLPDMPQLAAWAERAGFRPVGCYTLASKYSSTFMAVWRHQTRPTFFIAYHMGIPTPFKMITKRPYDFVTCFSRQIVLTTGTSKSSPLLPPQPTDYTQAFSEIDLDGVWQRHQAGEEYLARVGHVQTMPMDLCFEDLFHEGIRRQMAFLQGLRLGVLRAPYWYLVNRRRWHNKSIEEQHRQGRIRMPDPAARAPAGVVTAVPLARPVEPVPVAMGQVSEDLPCLKCGYNLRGLPLDGRCPECGTAIGRSTYGNALRFSEPAWVRQLAGGARWILWGNLYVVAAAFLAQIALLGGMSYATTSWSIMIPGLVWLVGCWKLTTPDPAEQVPGRIGARGVARWTAVASQLVIPIGAVAEKRFPQLSLLIWAAWWAVALVAMVALLHHCRQLTLRIPSPGLSWQLRIITWGIGILGFLELLACGVHLAATGMVMAVSATTQSSSPGVQEPLIGGFVCSAGVDLLVFRLWWAVLAFLLRRALRRAAEAAAGFWNTEAVPICARPAAPDRFSLPRPDTVELDASGCVATDLPCVRCGHALRGLKPYSACPQCGAAVGRSTHGDLLRFADPAWTSRLASGAGWSAAGVLCYLAGGILAASLRHAVLAGYRYPIALAILGLARLVGSWRLTTPEPDLPSGQSGADARAFARWMATIAFVIGPVDALFESSPAPYKAIAEGISGLLGSVGTFAFFLYAGHLTLRLPDARLHARSRLLMWGLVTVELVLTAWVVVFPSSAMADATHMATSQPGQLTLQIAVKEGTPSVLFLGFLGAVAGAVFLLVRLRRAFRQAADMASETWAGRLKMQQGGL
jgi:hypothetical protein